MSATLELSGLSVAYESSDGRRNDVVHDVGLTLEAGTIVGLTGESGCGKSTTAMAAIGYRTRATRIVSGSSRLGDVDLLALPIEQLRALWGRRVTYVSQNAAMALNPAIPIGRQLAQPLERHLGLHGPELRARRLELLEQVYLPEPERALKRYPHEFSGGQQQRIAIAIAIACRPDVLILDEPTTGLDVTTQARIASLLRELVVREKIAALHVSHDLSLLATIADRLIVMYAGEVVEHGPSHDVFASARHPYTQALLAAAPQIRGPRALAGIRGRPPAQVITDACPFNERCPHVQPVCTSKHPDLYPAAPAQAARCLLLDEIEPLTPSLIEPPQVARDEAVNVIEVDDVWCSYQQRSEPAVKGVSLVVGAGEAVGIVGESGSGKSTLLRAIIGLHPPSSGTIRLRGEELARRASGRPRRQQRELQLIFQNPDSSLNPRQSVGQIIARPLRLFRDDVSRSQEKDVVAELLESVKLPRQVARSYPGQLSGGQKQRVAIARALAARPSVLLCDEITSALDVSVQASILELLAELSAQTQTAVLFVSHDLAVIRHVTARALVMKDGEVCEATTTEELFRAPSHPYTRELLRSLPQGPQDGEPTEGVLLAPDPTSERAR